MPDVTAPLVNFATSQIGSYGALAVFLLMVLESACIPVPSEAIMLYGGFLVARGQASLIAIVAAGVAGNLVGSWLAYGAGRWLGAAGNRRLEYCPHCYECTEQAAD